jgi:hypothetical protein
MGVVILGHDRNANRVQIRSHAARVGRGRSIEAGLESFGTEDPSISKSHYKVGGKQQTKLSIPILHHSERQVTCRDGMSADELDSLMAQAWEPSLRHLPLDVFPIKIQGRAKSAFRYCTISCPLSSLPDC